jgi:hypothetical protein
LQNKYIQLSYGGYEGVCRMEVCKGYGQKTWFLQAEERLRAFDDVSLRLVFRV